MYIPDQIGNKHIRVTFSFDQPDQSRIQECDMSLEEIKHWISDCVEGELQGGAGSYIISTDGYKLICESDIHIKVKRPCDRCGKDLSVTINGQKELLYMPERVLNDSKSQSKNSNKGKNRKSKNPAKDYAKNSDGIQLQEEDLEIGFYPSSGVSPKQILAEMTILITPLAIRCHDNFTDGDETTCVVEQDENEIFTNNPFANF